MELKKVMFIFNPIAWGVRKRHFKKISEFKESAKKAGLEVNIEITSPEKSAYTLTKRAIQDKYNCFIVVGGDGTINEVANGIIKSGISTEEAPVVGLVPAGLGNDFAMGLGIPKNLNWIFKILQDSASLQFQLNDIAVDLGVAFWEEDKGRYFVNSFGIGLDAQLTKTALAWKEKFQFLSSFPLSGQGFYVLAGIKELFSRSPLSYGQVEVRIGDKSFSSQILLLSVTNGPHLGRIFRIAPEAEFTDGKLDICCIKEMGGLKTLWNIPRAFRGTHVFIPEVKTFLDGRLPTASSLTISSSEKLVCQMDGEIISPAKEYQISLVPKALKILVP